MKTGNLHEDEYRDGKCDQRSSVTSISLLNNMMEELPYAAHKKSPDLMITIKVSYETMIRRIIKRGRDYEQIEKILRLLIITIVCSAIMTIG